MDFDRDEHGKIAARPVADVMVRVEDGASFVRLVYVSMEHASGVASLQLSLTPLQSLRLARDLLASVEHELSGGEPDAP